MFSSRLDAKHAKKVIFLMKTSADITFATSALLRAFVLPGPGGYDLDCRIES